tara:strand:+ start:225 stop:725 length:501 start_codon:yes stop_codon:yes gene_type:complete
MKNNILTYGGFFGAIMCISSYAYLNSMISTTISMVVTFGALLVVLVMAGLAYRKSQEGFASFGELIKLYGGIIIMAILMSTIFSLIYMSTLDEATKSAISEKMMDNAMSMYESMGVPQDQMDIMSDELEKQFENMFSPSTLIQGALINFLMYFIISLIPAAILKKN